MRTELVFVILFLSTAFAESRTLLLFVLAIAFVYVLAMSYYMIRYIK